MGTLGFLLPVLESIIRERNEHTKNEEKTISEESKGRKKSPYCIILVPTNELCNQVLSVCLQFRKHLDVNSVHVHPKMTALEISTLKEVNNDVIISTPSSLLWGIRRGLVSMNKCRLVVFDEIDTLFDQSFYP